MSEKIATIKAFASLGFDRLGRATKDLKEEQLDWKAEVGLEEGLRRTVDHFRTRGQSQPPERGIQEE